MTERSESHQDRRDLWLRIEPVDTLFFRDGRPFDPATRAASGLPNPQILAGALRTEMLRRAGMDVAQLGRLVRGGERLEAALVQMGGGLGERIAQACFKGPYIGRAAGSGQPDDLFYPLPATLRRSVKGTATDTLLRLDPLGPGHTLPGWMPQGKGLVPLWSRTRHILKPLDKSWITQAGLSDFLSGKVPSPGDLMSSDALFGFEDRTGIAVASETGTAADGMIYATRRLVLRPGVRFWAHIEGSADVLGLLPNQDETRLLPFGGEGRQVALTPVRENQAPLCAGAAPNLPTASGRCLVLLTPAFFNGGGWHPPGLDLLAAAVPGHVPVSGWDLARGGPKPTRFGVAAGAVYFLSPDSNPPPCSGLGDIQDTSLGWGDYCEGVWHYA